jgi:8-oxo-dGTP pyrophosphatase MutT (NUDIX family)
MDMAKWGGVGDSTPLVRAAVANGVIRTRSRTTAAPQHRTFAPGRTVPRRQHAADAALDMVFDSSLREHIQRNLSSFELLRAEPGAHRAAAVAIAVVEEGDGARIDGLAVPEGWSREAALILTRRAVGLRNHPEQWALPGGRLDADESAEVAALRELAEEVGLDVGADAVLGRLDDFVTRPGSTAKTTASSRCCGCLSARPGSPRQPRPCCTNFASSASPGGRHASRTTSSRRSRVAEP